MTTKRRKTSRRRNPRYRGSLPPKTKVWVKDTKGRLTTASLVPSKTTPGEAILYIGDTRIDPAALGDATVVITDLTENRKIFDMARATGYGVVWGMIGE